MLSSRDSFVVITATNEAKNDRLWALSAFVAIGLVALPALSQQRPAMTAHFIDVGQAHATLLEFPCGTC